MERCTIRLKTGEARCTQLDGNVVVERLAAYEDTGLTPEEITARRWIPTKERLPDFEKRVLTMDKWGHITDRMLREFMSGKAYFTPDGMDPHKDIKYWMPLPEAPEVKR